MSSPSGVRQRASASEPITSPVFKSTCGRRRIENASPSKTRCDCAETPDSERSSGNRMLRSPYTEVAAVSSSLVSDGMLSLHASHSANPECMRWRMIATMRVVRALNAS